MPNKGQKFRELSSNVKATDYSRQAGSESTNVNVAANTEKRAGSGGSHATEGIHQLSQEPLVGSPIARSQVQIAQGISVNEYTKVSNSLRDEAALSKSKPKAVAASAPLAASPPEAKALHDRSGYAKGKSVMNPVMFSLRDFVFKPLNEPQDRFRRNPMFKKSHTQKLKISPSVVLDPPSAIKSNAAPALKRAGSLLSPSKRLTMIKIR